MNIYFKDLSEGEINDLEETQEVSLATVDDASNDENDVDDETMSGDNDVTGLDSATSSKLSHNVRKNPHSIKRGLENILSELDSFTDHFGGASAL